MHCNNAITECKSGHFHDSEMEAFYCNELSDRKERGEIKDFRSQVVYELGVCFHKVDFEVITSAGQLEIHEVKGPETKVWRLKRKMFEEKYPEIPYVVIKHVEKYEEKYRAIRREVLEKKFKRNREAFEMRRKKYIQKKRKEWKKQRKTGKRKIWVSNL